MLRHSREGGNPGRRMHIHSGDAEECFRSDELVELDAETNRLDPRLRGDDGRVMCGVVFSPDLLQLRTPAIR